MNIENALDEFGLGVENAVVIGSGILQALNIRESRDIDVVTSKETYQRLCADNRLRKEKSHGLVLLANNLLEVRTSWLVLGKDWDFKELSAHSTVIDGVCYNSLQFLLKVKESWLVEESARPKDINDIKLIKAYLKNKNGEDKKRVGKNR